MSERPYLSCRGRGGRDVKPETSLDLWGGGVLRTTSLGVVAALCREHHGYASAGRVAVYSFAVFEDGVPVAGFAWQPPPPGCAKAVCPEAPHAVLALSRMVAVPRDARALRHISKPLRYQMRHMIDRGRWPVLVTFHDTGQGHTGHVYKCSGWQRGEERKADTRTADDGSRISRYSNGKTHPDRGVRGQTTLVRWEHWACERGRADEHIAAHGWSRVPTGRNWTSGNPAFTWVQATGGGGTAARSTPAASAGRARVCCDEGHAYLTEVKP